MTYHFSVQARLWKSCLVWVEIAETQEENLETLEQRSTEPEFSTSAKYILRKSMKLAVSKLDLTNR